MSPSADQSASTEIQTLMDKPLTPIAKIVLWVVAVNALAGAGSLMVFPRSTDTLFFWEIKPPLSAALFGALYLCGAIIVGWLAFRGYWEPARFLVPVLVSAGIFISITTLLHLDRFTSGLKLIYWLIVYVGAPVIALGLYLWHERPSANWAVAVPVNTVTRLIAITLGAGVLVLGAVLYVFPSLVSGYWPWAISPLMIRIFISWFGAFGVGLLWFIFERDWRRLHPIATLMIASAVIDLLMIVVHRADLITTGPNLWVYCSHLIILGLAGLAMHGLQWRAARR